MNEFKTKASQKKLDKFIELVLTKADKKGIRIASLCNDAIAEISLFWTNRRRVWIMK